MKELMSIIFDRDEFTWQDLLYQLVRSEQMDPWDIDVSLVSKRFIESITALKELDFRVSGKVLLAASILLKLKTENFFDKDLNNFEDFVNEVNASEVVDQYEDIFMNDFFEMNDPSSIVNDEPPKIKLKTPQPRERKVSIYDLVDGLQRALEFYDKKAVRRSTQTNKKEQTRKLKKSKFDINILMKSVFGKINEFLNEKRRKKMLFSEMVSEHTTKEDKILTFLPLVFLSTEEKIRLFQENHFGDIEISLHPNLSNNQQEI